MRLRRILLAGITFAGLYGWAQEQAARAPQTSTVFVYRYKQFVGSALEPSVYCDDAQLARMDNGRYFSVKLEPGKHVFHSNDRQSGVELNVEPGQQYFIRVEMAAGFMKGRGRLVL